jgi:hypothetical protein
MDAPRFDALARRLAAAPSRRSLLAALVGGATVAAGGPPARAACKPNGARCARSDAGACCSGVCKRKRGKSRCAAAPGARGCTVEANACTTLGSVPCPELPEGAFGLCVPDADGRPFCANTTECFACATNRECAEEFGRPMRCVTCGDLCQSAGFDTACVEFDADR